MGRAIRAQQFRSSEVAIVHTVQRCVRRAFLAGVDEKTGRDFSFRREWIRRRMEALASVFGIDVLTYAIMSNHMHIILRNRPDVVAGWSDQQVAIRWLRVFPGRRLEEHLAEPTDHDVNMLVAQSERMLLIRQRLSDISWFMRALSEPIARMANHQDECTGRFWEGRFKAVRIVDDAGLLACAMYVDLNPIRAAIVMSPEQAVHTSAYDRMQGEQGQRIASAAFDRVPATREDVASKTCQTPVETLKAEQTLKRRNPTGRQIRRDEWLAPLTISTEILAQDPQMHRGGVRASDKGFLQINWRDYWQLLGWTAKQAIGIMPTAVPDELVKLLSSRGIEATMWRELVWNFKKYFGKSSCIGTAKSMSADAKRQGRRWHRGQRLAKRCFSMT